MIVRCRSYYIIIPDWMFREKWEKASEYFLKTLKFFKIFFLSPAEGWASFSRLYSRLLRAPLIWKPSTRPIAVLQKKQLFAWIFDGARDATAPPEPMRTNAAAEKKREEEEEEEDHLRSQFQALRRFGMSNVLSDDCSSWKCYRLEEGKKNWRTSKQTEPSGPSRDGGGGRGRGGVFHRQ